MAILLIVLCAALVLIRAMHPSDSRYSDYERQRRASGSGELTLEDLRRATYQDLLTWRYVLEMLVLVLFLMIAVMAFGWGYGLLLFVLVFFAYRPIAKIPFLANWTQGLYDENERRCINVALKIRPITTVIREPIIHSATDIASREELEYIIQNSDGILGKREKTMIASVMHFDQKVVRDFMTPRAVIDSIDAGELLGPLILDGLHKTGHSQFPVTDGDIDHVVGMLHIQDLLTVAGHKSSRVRTVMEPHVYYIRDDQLLAHALAAYLRTKHHLFIVVNQYRETVGLLSMEDVLEALIGEKIVDEFDAHDDLRKVAERNPHHNNLPKNHSDV